MNDLCDVHGRALTEPLRGLRQQEALYLEAFEHYVRTQGSPVWDRLRKERLLAPALRTC